MVEIDAGAPVRASAERSVAATPVRVWSAIVDIERWPEWNPDVKSSVLEREPAVGTRFRWKAGPWTIRSRITNIEKERLISWTGRTIGISAVHVWRIGGRDGETVVSTEESWDGLLPRFFRGPLRRMLRGSLESGLGRLAAEVEGPPRVEALVFDLDGTLLDSRNSVYRAGLHTLESLGLEERSYDEIVSCMGGGIEGLVECIVGEAGSSRLGEGVDIFMDHIRENHARNSELFPNVEDVLEDLGDKRKFVLTNGKMEIARNILEAKGIYGYFEDLFTGDDDTCLKPSPCPVMRMLERTGIRPGGVLLVGDMDLDVEAGRAAGVMTCGVTYGAGKREEIEAAGPDLMIDDISELKGLIR